MIPDLVYAAGIAGALSAVVQLVRPRTLDLRALIFGSIAVLILLGLTGLGWQGVLALEREALAHPAPAALAAEVQATQRLLVATGLLTLGVAFLGGIAVWVRKIALGRKAKAAPTGS